MPKRLKEIELAPEPSAKRKKKSTSRPPSIKRKLLVELRQKRKSLSNTKKALNKEINQVKRDIRSLSCHRKKKGKFTVPFVAGGGVDLSSAFQ
jgi:predicted flavoprotein YhiN